MSSYRQQTHSSTRDSVLIAHASDMLSRTGISKDDFADSLSKALYALAPGKAVAKEVPDLEAMTRTADHQTYSRVSGTWVRKVLRWLDGSVSIPSWIEEAWVQALLPEWRERCLIELAGRYGFIPVRPVVLSGMDGMQTFGALMRGVGDVAGLGSNVFDDLMIDEKDRVWLPEFIAALDSMGAKCATLSRLAKQALERTSQLNSAEVR